MPYRKMRCNYYKYNRILYALGKVGISEEYFTCENDHFPVVYEIDLSVKTHEE